MERIEDREFTRKVYVSEVEGPVERDRSLVKWENRVEG